MSILNDIAAKVDEGGGLATCTLGDLRKVANKDKLGPFVLEAAAKALDTVGLAFYPTPPAPLRQHHEVRVFKRDSPIGAVIQAVLEPTERGDDHLRATANGKYNEVVQKIKELIG
jgi:hypothetical protein